MRLRATGTSFVFYLSDKVLESTIVSIRAYDEVGTEHPPVVDCKCGRLGGSLEVDNIRRHNVDSFVVYHFLEHIFQRLGLLKVKDM
ncbi:hypothetical protein CVT25_002364 [Psilocybe cyanescens]|uniref:Uncharacterized protein n=1 Tax=Psilocybe cyanescens TaxID=93625 RepID=A0A409WKL8_PSICY|nr:hypothetical protein CVT25_002364 [Psilocybe cyanescens]